jgi:hypothetical protein
VLYHALVSWEAVYTDEFEAWWSTLSNEQQEQIDAAVEVLEERGPALGRPLVDTLAGSSLNNLKELRVSKHGTLRILFIFNPLRQALLLYGGDKADNWKDWYRHAISEAERLYGVHLSELKEEGLLP